MIRPALILLLASLATTIATESAFAYKQFMDVWKDVYLEDCDDEDFVKLVKKEAKCNVCHQGRKKKHHNTYGMYFVGMIGKDDKKDEEKVLKALNEVADMNSDPEDDKSPTYGELIAQGKLPGGTLEEVNSEPDAEEQERQKKRKEKKDN